MTHFAFDRNSFMSAQVGYHEPVPQVCSAIIINPRMWPMSAFGQKQTLQIYYTCLPATQCTTTISTSKFFSLSLICCKH